tara:strand:+ start:130 stop:669 length:540 start_codon:yes stop_codon:yes gene_type:complete
MHFEELNLKGGYLINLDKFEDFRGFNSRLFCDQEFADIGLNQHWKQINNTYNMNKGTLRGLHFQREPYAEIKLVRCIRGSIWDVMIDIRKGSETFGKYAARELNADNRSMMYVPKGFAHGFLSLTDNTEVIYMVSEIYNKKYEAGIIWNDPDLNISWPIEPTIMSEKDGNANKLKDVLI